MRSELIALVALVGSCAAPPPDSAPRQARELVGRTAGAAQRCVLIQPTQSLRVAEGDRHTLVYGSGKTVWANHLGRGCGFGIDDLLIVEPVGSYYCRGDLVRSMDRLSRIPGPTCVLGDFIPYTR